MNISKQLKNYRKKLDISQEGLAEIVHVSRQTISNWENDKSYPDLQSLVLLSEYFEISLDELVKGDIVTMKNELEKNQLAKLTLGMFFGGTCMILSIALNTKFMVMGILCMSISILVMCWSAFKVEKFKKDKDIQSYEEIVSYMEGKEIVRNDNTKERHKRIWRERFLYAVISAIATFFAAYLMLYLIK